MIRTAGNAAHKKKAEFWAAASELSRLPVSVQMHNAINVYKRADASAEASWEYLFVGLIAVGSLEDS